MGKWINGKWTETIEDAVRHWEDERGSLHDLGDLAVIKTMGKSVDLEVGELYREYQRACHDFRKEYERQCELFGKEVVDLEAKKVIAELSKLPLDPKEREIMENRRKLHEGFANVVFKGTPYEDRAYLFYVTFGELMERGIPKDMFE